MDLPACDRIVTHDDLDGAASAALASLAVGIGRFFFAGPVAIVNGEVETTTADLVCDLPCPVRVGMWFDHHPGNLEDARLRGLLPEAVPGRHAPEKSCARVVYDFFRERVTFPDFIADTVRRTDIVDSFDYLTEEEWRARTPERLLSDSISLPGRGFREDRAYLERVIGLLKQGTMEEALADPEVKGRAEAHQALEEKSLDLFRQDSSFHPDDPAHEVAVVDLTRHNRKPEVTRQAAFLLHHQALAVLLVGNAFRAGKKTNDLTFSMSLSWLMNRVPHRKDVGEIMRTLNIGDGHRGAGAGRISCASKDEMLKRKKKTLDEIVRLWKGQV